jgi:energy-coupling factor transporter ATP-binding protein EcfA2
LEIIRAKNVNYYYGDKKILENLCFSIDEGDNIALLGRNGSGKSTLIKGLNNLIRKQEGEILIDQVRLKKGHETEMYTIFSESNEQILMSTVHGELSLGLIQQNKTPTEIAQIITEKLSQFGLLQYIHESPYILSTGEKKKLLLATALSLDPGLLILDEPFAGLDVVSQKELCQYIARIPCVKIIATHEYNYARKCCNKAFVLHQRKLICFENIYDILDNEDLLKQYYLL